jgi:hypothetical protein
MTPDCGRENEVMEAIAFGRWPAQCPELAAHAASCVICADVVAVARALHEDREHLCREAHPPAAGMVWWRATIRARAEAARTATQPISILQGVAGACIAGAAAGLVTVAWQSWHWSYWINSLASGHGLPILLAVATGVVFAPLALYLTLADD